MKFRKKPSEIEAVQFKGFIDDPEIPEHVKIRNIEGRFEIFNTLHDSWILIKVNDYFRTDIVGDPDPIDLAYMLANYESLDAPITAITTDDVHVINTDTDLPIEFVASVEIEINAAALLIGVKLTTYEDLDDLSKLAEKNYTLIDASKDDGILILRVAELIE